MTPSADDGPLEGAMVGEGACDISERERSGPLRVPRIASRSWRGGPVVYVVRRGLAGESSQTWSRSLPRSGLAPWANR